MVGQSQKVSVSCESAQWAYLSAQWSCHFISSFSQWSCHVVIVISFSSFRRKQEDRPSGVEPLVGHTDTLIGHRWYCRGTSKGRR